MPLKDGQVNTTDGHYLYYYASVPAFKSMLASREIWLSDIRKSNDSDEIAYGMRQIKHRLDAVLSSIGMGRRPFVVPEDYLEDNGLGVPMDASEFLDLGSKLSAALRIIYADMGEQRDSLYAHFKGERCFALCFTGDGDLLSQWRGYGDDARGIAIGFDKASVLRYVRAHMTDAIPGVTLHLRPVYYRERDDALHAHAKDDLRQAPFLSRRFEVTRGHLFREDEIGQIDRLLYRMLMDMCSGEVPRRGNGMPDIDAVVARCKDLAPLLKQPTFFEEREERLFAWANPDDERIARSTDGTIAQAHLGTAVRDGGKLAIHFALPVIACDGRCDQDHITVGRVVLGPRCAADRQDIGALLRESGMTGSVEVLNSATTYVG